MDFNLVVLCGRLAAPPEIRQFESGSRLARYLITVRTEDPRRRVDVIPITLWDPPPELLDAEPELGTRVWAVASLQRRFWSGEEQRRSRLEVVADQVCLRDPDSEDEEQ